MARCATSMQKQAKGTNLSVELAVLLALLCRLRMLSVMRKSKLCGQSKFIAKTNSGKCTKQTLPSRIASGIFLLRARLIFLQLRVQEKNQRSIAQPKQAQHHRGENKLIKSRLTNKLSYIKAPTSMQKASQKELTCSSADLIALPALRCFCEHHQR